MLILILILITGKAILIKFPINWLAIKVADLVNRFPTDIQRLKKPP